MRVAVYAISKNEALNAERFMRSCRDADVVVVTDTGSDDGTPGLLQKLGAQVHETRIEPWRFDEARNMALDNVPEDIDVCISIDIDETLQPGWREPLEKLWEQGAGLVSYLYIAEWRDKEQTVPAVTCYRSKIHARHGFRWHRPVHEVVLPDDPSTLHLWTDQIAVHHHRSQPTNYIELLDQLIAENPADPDAYIQRGADLLQLKRLEEAARDYATYLQMTQNNLVVPHEINQSRRCFAWLAIAKARHGMGSSPDEIIRAMLHAVAEYPNSREAWTYLADAWQAVENWPAAYGAAMTALSITERGPGASEEICWGDYPKQIASAAFSRIMNRGGN